MQVFQTLIVIFSSSIAMACSGGEQVPAAGGTESNAGQSIATEAGATSPQGETGGNALSGRNGSRSASHLTKEGRIETGVECPVLHTPDGEIWALAAAGKELTTGAYVRVHGERADMSFCQQGEGTIDVKRVEPVAPPARDRDPARAGGIAVTTDYVVGEWAAKGGDCREPDFAVTTNANGMALIQGRLNGRRQTGAVDVGRTPQIHFDAPIGSMAIETRGPDGLAVMPPRSRPKVTLGSVAIGGDGVVFVKCG